SDFSRDVFVFDADDLALLRGRFANDGTRVDVAGGVAARRFFGFRSDLVDGSVQRKICGKVRFSRGCVDLFQRERQDQAEGRWHGREAGETHAEIDANCAKLRAGACETGGTSAAWALACGSYARSGWLIRKAIERWEIGDLRTGYEECADGGRY